MDIDFSKLSRNFIEHPMGLREELNYEDVYYLYWELNLTKKQTGEILGCSDKKVYNYTKEHGLIKTQEMITASQKNLMIERYGKDNYMKTEQGVKMCGDAVRKVFKEHGKEIVQKRENTYFKNTGYKNPSQNPVIKRKKEETSLKNNGTKNPQQNEAIKQQTQNTFKEKYNGNPLSSKSNIYTEKVIKGIEDKYGCKNVMKNKLIAQKTAKTLKENQEVYKQKNLEKYGVEYPSKLQETIDKINKTKTKNGTFNSSLEELTIKELLEKMFIVVYNKTHKPRYPFRCDFYLPEIDLFIEYNGTWTHGFRPYDPNDMECQKDAEILRRKAETSDYYKNALYNWTVRDVKKRKIAKDNHLNWLEFFNMESFMEWYNNL